MTLSLAELAADAAPYLDADPNDRPSWSELFELRRFLHVGLTDLIAGRDAGTNPDTAPLRLTKGRVRTAAICPAQVLGEINPFGINFNIAVGIVCDAAAGVLALHPGFRPNGWFEGLRCSLDQEHPHLTAFVDGLGRSDRADFDLVVDDLCGVLPDLLGDIRPHRPTVHHRIAHVPTPGVRITGEIDISCDVGIGTDVAGRLLAEVKSGRFSSRITDELAHYALITILQHLPAHEPDGPPPLVLGCAVSLADLAVTPVMLNAEMLETSARRLLDTTKGLLAIDETMKEGGRPPTNPGDHCRWCRRIAECGDAPDLVMAEMGETLRPLDPVTDADDDDHEFNDLGEDEA